MSRSRKATGLPPVIRDTVLLAVGASMLVYMTVTFRVNAWLVGAALACLGLPIGIGTLSLSRGKTETPPTPERSSSSVDAG